MARLFADAMNALGALPVGHLVEVTKDDLVSSFVGDTTSKVVAVFRKAMGGVLFIDEAYQLGNDSHGKDAIDMILTLAENNRGKLVVIMAGYTKEMGEFVQINSGIPSRFDCKINFRDYTAEELTEIFRRMVSSSPEKLSLDADAESHVENVFKRMYLTRSRTFGNAREVRTVFVKAVERMKNRLAADPSSPRFITMRDIEGDEKNNMTVDEILAELDDMVGMGSVKDQLRKIARTVELNRRRALTGRAQAKVENIHIAITGSPGTGKTEIAKRLGRIFKAMGVLSSGHVVERERKTLLDSYANSAGANMDKAVDEALGGVLFIDEAYNLI
ncbi:MAG: AAA family ATPase, partial [Duncaniella sp.]|nr:AAA family ATPase [Duncaniella sp.]